MRFDKIIRSNIALADKLSDSVQDDVYIYPWIGNTDTGGPLYGAANIQKAIVEEKEFQRRLPDGQEVTQRAQVTIPRPIAPNGATERREPVDPRDLVVLPSGYGGPILHVDGLTDPSTHAPYMFIIILG